jgi:hypothetical protein
MRARRMVLGRRPISARCVEGQRVGRRWHARQSALRAPALEGLPVVRVGAPRVLRASLGDVVRGAGFQVFEIEGRRGEVPPFRARLRDCSPAGLRAGRAFGRGHIVPKRELHCGEAATAHQFRQR